MAKLKQYNLSGEETGEIDISDAIASAEANGQMIKDYLVALRNNARQWSASTKGRAEVAHTTKKPHPQKGRGAARQGSLVSPQFRGGGVVFGPKPKFDQHVRINRKERKAAIRCLLGEKIRDNRLIAIENTTLEKPRTQALAQFLKKCQLGPRVLFLGEANYEQISLGDFTETFNVKTDQHHNFIKSLRNLPKTEFSLAKNVNGYDLSLARVIVATPAAIKELEEWLAA